jgi:hypothetical protein
MRLEVWGPCSDATFRHARRISSASIAVTGRARARRAPARVATHRVLCSRGLHRAGNAGTHEVQRDEACALVKFLLLCYHSTFGSRSDTPPPPLPPPSRAAAEDLPTPLRAAAPGSPHLSRRCCRPRPRPRPWPLLRPRSDHSPGPGLGLGHGGGGGAPSVERRGGGRGFPRWCSMGGDEAPVEEAGRHGYLVGA